jgi:hypothetical protein
MKAGPKGTLSAPPLDLRRLPKAGAPAVSPSLSVLEVAADPYRSSWWSTAS